MLNRLPRLQAEENVPVFVGVVLGNRAVDDGAEGGLPCGGGTRWHRGWGRSRHRGNQRVLQIQAARNIQQQDDYQKGGQVCCPRSTTRWTGPVCRRPCVVERVIHGAEVRIWHIGYGGSAAVERLFNLTAVQH